MKLNIEEKRYYSIGEVASNFNVNPSLIRFWEQEFKILSPKKNSRGNRKRGLSIPFNFSYWLEKEELNFFSIVYKETNHSQSDFGWGDIK